MTTGGRYAMRARRLQAFVRLELRPGTAARALHRSRLGRVQNEIE